MKPHILISRKTGLCLAAIAASHLVGVATPAKAQTNLLKFQSPDKRVSLVELYTSEGCSSCPPAEEWLSGQRKAPGLWRDFVPVSFHVDYWDYLGWRDRWAKQEYTRRQEAYAKLWHARNVYTPEFVRNGAEWAAWRDAESVKDSANESAGVLTLDSSDTNKWMAGFSPATMRDVSYEIHLALLTGNVQSDVKAGENRGRILHHDFVVVSSHTSAMNRKGNNWSGSISIKIPAGLERGDLALAAWVTESGSLEPVQATGGWISRSRPD